MSVADTVKLKIFNISNRVAGSFGFSIVGEDGMERYERSISERARMVADIVDLEDEVEELNDLLDREESPKDENPIDFNAADPLPTDPVKRRVYVSEVSLFHTNVLAPKIKQMISSSHQLLELGENTENQNSVLRGAILSFRSILAWGDKMVLEQRSYEAEIVDKPVDKKKR